MSDEIINLDEYRRRRDGEDAGEEGVFALWGAEGERSRFALPLWRAVYVGGGDRGGVVWSRISHGQKSGAVGTEGRLHPFVVLDLKEEPARLDFRAEVIAGMGGRAAVAPLIRELDEEGAMVVFLGSDEERRWFMVVTGRQTPGLEGAARDDVLFLAGECAGLLFMRGFADEAE
ncbi:MAG: hypothetical protein ACE5GJ_01495 [Gemmatimonadota bacterium]